MFETFTGQAALKFWLYGFIAAGVLAGVVTGFFKARKIQPKGFKWITFRNEAIYGVLNVAISGTIIGYATNWLTKEGLIRFNSGAPAWWVILLEYTLYFFLFDTWFYWLHRWMHSEPFYSKIHKLHHKSTAPNLLTTISVNPLESFINGGFVPLFLCIFTVHGATMALIAPTNIIMGLYVHSGYELFPRWWNKSWVTKWFITTTFHDQHHKYFTVNFGGYTTIWDRMCSTMRPKFEDDYLKLKDRSRPVPGVETVE